MGVEAFINGISFPITADLTGLKTGLAEAEGELGKVEGRFAGLSASFKAKGVAIGAGMTGAGLAIVGLTDAAKDTNAGFAGTALTLGTTTDNIRDLALATSDAGFPLQEVAKTFDLLARAGVQAMTTSRILPSRSMISGMQPGIARIR